MVHAVCDAGNGMQEHQVACELNDGEGKEQIKVSLNQYKLNR